jgi:hypothetical protein
METVHFWWKTNIQLLPSFEVNIENCQPEDGCFPRELHPVNNPNIYNVEGENRLSPGLQPLTTGSVFNILFFHSGSVILFTIVETILLSSTKQNIQVFIHLRVIQNCQPLP